MIIHCLIFAFTPVTQIYVGNELDLLTVWVHNGNKTNSPFWNMGVKVGGERNSSCSSECKAGKRKEFLTADTILSPPIIAQVIRGVCSFWGMWHWSDLHSVPFLQWAIEPLSFWLGNCLFGDSLGWVCAVHVIWGSHSGEEWLRIHSNWETGHSTTFKDRVHFTYNNQSV